MCAPGGCSVHTEQFLWLPLHGMCPVALLTLLSILLCPRRVSLAGGCKQHQQCQAGTSSLLPASERKKEENLAWIWPD